MITKTYNEISKEEFLKLYFKFINIIDEKNILTEKMILFLVEFLLLEGDKFKYNRFIARSKMIVKEKLLEKYNWKLSLQNMTIKLIELERLGYIYKDVDGVKMFNKEHEKIINKILESEDYEKIIFKIKIKRDELNKR